MHVLLFIEILEMECKNKCSDMLGKQESADITNKKKKRTGKNKSVFPCSPDLSEDPGP